MASPANTYASLFASSESCIDFFTMALWTPPATAIIGARPMQMRAICQQLNREMQSPVPKAKKPSRIGPTASAAAKLIIDESYAMVDVS